MHRNEGIWTVRRLAMLVGGLFAVATAVRFAWLFVGRTGAYGTLDPAGQPVGTDFTLIWSAGRLVLEGRAAAVYDWASLEAAEHAAHASAAIGFWGWHYPPPFLLVAATLAPLPYLPALLVWQGTTLAAAIAVVWRILPRPETLVAAFGAPVVFVCLAHGQNGFLTAALFGGGLLALERRPALAGILFGCLAYKPHVGLVLPLALLCGGHVRALAAAGATVFALGLASLALLGAAPWMAFVATADLTRTIVLEAGGTGWYKMGSAFAWARMTGASIPAAYALQGTVTLAAMAGVATVWRRRTPFALKAASVLLGALLATPYLLDYDLALAGPALAFLAAHGLRTGFRRREVALLSLVWLTPLVARHVAYWANVPLAFLGTAILFVLVVGRALAEAPGGRTEAPRPGYP